MAERLSFYVPRRSFLHRLNPLTKLALAFALILVAFISPYSWTAVVCAVLVIFPLAVIGGVYREYLGTVLRLVVPSVGFIFVMQSLFVPGGETVLFRFWVLRVTVESVQQAFLTAARIFNMISAFILLLLTTHPSELMTDLTQRGMPGNIAYVFISTLQILPQMQAKARTIIAAQRSRGLETEGTLIRRVRALVPLVGPLVFGSLVEVEERAIAIEARGFTSPLKKTSLHEVADTPLDRALRWGLLGPVLLTVAGRGLVR
ncbi:MAG TPA: energy-coupling factor transporter transmembrane component T [Anaerolinea sp.]|nr:energy-coupling factor transporter transmembrane component T [Anaerolinea sp.]